MSLKFPAALLGRRAAAFPAPLHWWNLDDDASWQDDGYSVNAFHLVEGGANPTVASSGGPGLQDVANVAARNKWLARGSRVYAPNDDGSMSYSIWSKKIVQGQGVIFAWHNATGGGLFPSGGNRIFSLHTDGASPTSRIYSRFYDDATATSQSSTGLVYAQNVWNHIVGTFDGATKQHKLYLNGVYIGGTTTSSFTTFNTTDAMTCVIGSMPNSLGTTGGFHRGYVGMAGIWDAVLSEENVTFLYNGGLGRQFNDL